MVKHIEQELNRLYKYNWDEYNTRLEHYKNIGYKILRNYQGDHKVEYSPKLDEMFGGVFGKIFRGK